MAGRKSLPSIVKSTKNTQRKSRINKNEPKGVPASYMDPPDYVATQKYAKQVWDRTMPILVSMGILLESDIDAFAQYCVANSIYREAVIGLGINGLTYDSAQENGAKLARKSPYIEIINQQARIMISFAGEFGLTPASRSKVFTGGNEDNNPLDKFTG